MREMTVKAWGKKLIQNDAALSVKFLLNSKEKYWNLYGTRALDVILVKDYSDWETCSQMKGSGPKS